METLTAAVVILALLPPEAGSAALASSDPVHTPPTTTGAGFALLPLVPRHALLDRRRRELRSLGLSKAEAEEDLSDGGLQSAAHADDEGINEYSRRSRSRRLDDDKHDHDHHHQQIGALYQGYGTHYVDLWVGTPPQRQTVIVDTGSGQTAFPCSACTDCGESYHTDSYFVEADSSTFDKLDCSSCIRGDCKNEGKGADREICRISMHYSEGSKWNAYEAVDVTYASGPHDGRADPNHASSFAFKLAFGCQTEITGLFKTQLADGILGMCNRPSSFWSQMSRRKKDVSRRFSLCFTRQPTPDREGTTAGALTLGGSDERFHSSGMVYAANVKVKSAWYTVRLKNIFLREGGGGSAEIEEGDTIHALDADEATLNADGVIVDSGTTDTYLTDAIGKAFLPKWKEIVGLDYTSDVWVKLTDEQLRSLPTVLFQMGASKDGANDHMPDGTGLVGSSLDGASPSDVVVAMPASHYMSFDPSKGVYMGRLHFKERDSCTLGANLMMGHDVLFDVENGRIGWAESDCDYFGITGVEPLDVGTEGLVGKDVEDEAEGVEEDATEDVQDVPEGFEEDATEDVEDEADGFEEDGTEELEDEAEGLEEDATEGVEEEAVSTGPSGGMPPYVGPGVASKDGVCTTTECRLEVVAIMAAALVIFALQRRLRSHHRTEAVPTFDEEQEFDLQEQNKELSYSCGYSDIPPVETELSEHGVEQGSDDDDDEYDEKELIIT